MTTITLPKRIAERLERYAIAQQRSPEAIALEFIEAALSEQTSAAPETPSTSPNDDPELLELVARIKALPPNPNNIIPPTGNLAEVLRAMQSPDIRGQEHEESLEELVARIKATPPNPNNIIPPTGNLAEMLQMMSEGEPDQELLEAFTAAELELRAINRADDIAEGRI